MGRKVFISVLGAGLYRSCKYAKDDFCSEETNFIQYATLGYLKASTWSADSRAYFLLTEKARKENWDVENGMRYDKSSNREIDYKGLHRIIDEAGFLFPAEDISIPDGKDENEMWKIFEIVYGLLKEGDELYMDLTHSFRYLPMLMLVLGNYAKFLKGAVVSSLTYGNYEAMDSATNTAPIVNLLPLSSLQDWTFATADFLENGYADRLVSLSKKGLEPLMRNEETRTEDTKKLRGLVNRMETFSMDLRTCRGQNVIAAKTTESAKQEIPQLETVVIPQLKPVLQKLMKSVEQFEEPGSIDNSFRAAQWCYDNQQYQQATTFLEEGVISFFCHRHHIALDDRMRRELITGAFFILKHEVQKKDWRVKEEDLILLEEIVNDEMLRNKSLVDSFGMLVELRNDYNHCGMRKQFFVPSAIKEKIRKCLQTIIPILYPQSQKVEEDNIPSIFINFSNHPSSLWKEPQMDAAKKYGVVEDMTFPVVDPGASIEDVLQLAHDYTDKIIVIAKKAHVTVHIMGEMVFVFNVVSRLKEQGIRCLASTTVRNAEDTDDGRKIYDFGFVGFREY